MIRQFLYRIKHRLTRHVVWELSEHIDARFEETMLGLDARIAELRRQSAELGRQSTELAQIASLEAGELRQQLSEWHAAERSLQENVAADTSSINHRLDNCLNSLRALEERLMDLRAQATRGFEELAPLESKIHRIGETADLIARKLPNDCRRIRCLLLINYMQAWDSLADVYQFMRADAEFEVTVATINGRHSEEAAHRTLDEFGIPHLRLIRESGETLNAIKAIGPDVIFRQHPWDDELPVALKTESLSFARLCYVPYYGLQVIEDFGASDHADDLHTDQAYHRACWRIFCEHDLVRDLYRRNALLAGSNVVVTGHPKLKRLHNLITTRPHWPLAERAHAPKPYRLIWAPHHSVQYDWMNFGMFALIMNDMLRWAKTDASIEFVLRPHPSLFPFMRSGEVSPDASPAQFEEFLAAWQALANTAIDERSDYAALFAASDAMLTDGISFLTEYQMFDKPLIFIERPDHARFNKLGELVVQGCIRAATFESVAESVAALRAGLADETAPKRQAVINQLVPKENPAKLIVEDIKRGLLPRMERAHPVRSPAYAA